MTELYFESYEIPAADLGEENPLPFFRGDTDDLTIEVADNVPADERRQMGCALASRWLPFRMQDGYTRKRSPHLFRTVILENDFLRARFSPEHDGRLLSLVDKRQGRELLERNPVFQPVSYTTLTLPTINSV